MGCCQSGSDDTKPLLSHHAHHIKDRTPATFMTELRQCGVLEDIEIMVGVDATRSNEMNGAVTYGGRSLHDVSYNQGLDNPYATAMRFSTKFLQKDIHGEVPLYFFGSDEANQHGGLMFIAECKGAAALQRAYCDNIRRHTLSGPTLFIALIEEAIRRVRASQKFHVLLILTDGMVQEEEQHYKVLNTASQYPLVIVCVGIGDGPWDEMQRFDRKMPRGRVFDNFHFVPMSQILRSNERPDRIEEEFFFRSFMKIPHQYHDIKKHLKYKPTAVSTRHLHEAGHAAESADDHDEHAAAAAAAERADHHTPATGPGGPPQYQYQRYEPVNHAPPGYR